MFIFSGSKFVRLNVRLNVRVKVKAQSQGSKFRVKVPNPNIDPDFGTLTPKFLTLTLVWNIDPSIEPLTLSLPLSLNFTLTLTLTLLKKLLEPQIGGRRHCLAAAAATVAAAAAAAALDTLRLRPLSHNPHKQLSRKVWVPARLLAHPQRGRGGGLPPPPSRAAGGRRRGARVAPRLRGVLAQAVRMDRGWQWR